MGDIKVVYFAVKLTFNIKVMARNTSHFHLPQIILHSKLCREKTFIIIVIIIECKILQQYKYSVVMQMLMQIFKQLNQYGKRKSSSHHQKC